MAAPVMLLLHRISKTTAWQRKAPNAATDAISDGIVCNVNLDYFTLCQSFSIKTVSLFSTPTHNRKLNMHIISPGQLILSTENHKINKSN